MNIGPELLIGVSWLVFLVYWVASSFSAKRIERGEGGAGVARRIVNGLVGFVLFFRAADPRLGFLSHRFLPDEPRVAWVGAILAAAGVAVAIWSRIHLGRYWSATVALKSEHKLIRSGPYLRIRHPIYTGILMGLFGSAIVIGRYASILGAIIFVVIFALKARKEETLLAGQFGPAFEEHRQHTGFLLPKVFGAR